MLMSVSQRLLHRWFTYTYTDLFTPDVYVINEEHAQELVNLLQQHFNLAEEGQDEE